MQETRLSRIAIERSQIISSKYGVDIQHEYGDFPGGEKLFRNKHIPIQT